MAEMTTNSSMRDGLRWIQEFLDKNEIELEDKLQISQTLANLERSTGVTLTPGAKLMLLLPIAEAIQAENEDHLQLVDDKELHDALAAIVEACQAQPAQTDTDINAKRLGGLVPQSSGRRGTFSVIKAFFKKFCDIPPFCSGRDR